MPEAGSIQFHAWINACHIEASSDSSFDLMMLQADVLVNSVATDAPNWNRAGAICQAFVTKGGDSFKQVRKPYFD